MQVHTSQPPERRCVFLLITSLPNDNMHFAKHTCNTNTGMNRHPSFITWFLNQTKPSLRLLHCDYYTKDHKQYILFNTLHAEYTSNTHRAKSKHCTIRLYMPRSRPKSSHQLRASAAKSTECIHSTIPIITTQQEQRKHLNFCTGKRSCTTDTYFPATGGSRKHSTQQLRPYMGLPQATRLAHTVPLHIPYDKKEATAHTVLKHHSLLLCCVGQKCRPTTIRLHTALHSFNCISTQHNKLGLRHTTLARILHSAVKLSRSAPSL
jgi:hypothetical protein